MVDDWQCSAVLLCCRELCSVQSASLVVPYRAVLTLDRRTLCDCPTNTGHSFSIATM